ncbi:MAG: response regulator [Pseudomonadota bacterium]
MAKGVHLFGQTISGTLGSALTTLSQVSTDLGNERLNETRSKRGNGMPARILVVEDQPEVREVTLAMVKALGHETVGAADGAEALALLRSDPFDLALLDIALPDMSGEQVAEIILNESLDVAVAFVTGLAVSGVRETLADNWPDQALLAKPYRLADLRAVLERSL